MDADPPPLRSFLCEDLPVDDRLPRFLRDENGNLLPGDEPPDDAPGVSAAG